jgi:hypothetical protein
MVAHIISSFKGVEKMSHHFVFDYVADLFWLGKIQEDAAVAYLQTEADLQLYQQMLSRDVNFRPGDTSSVWENAQRLRYLQRLFRREGDATIRRIEATQPMLHEVPHDGLRSGELYFRAFGERLKIVHLLRHPVDLAWDLLRRGFGSRVGFDPREFQFTLKGARGPVHIYLEEIDQSSGALSEHDLVVATIERSMSVNLEGYSKLDSVNKRNVRLCFFDDFCIDPRSEVEALELFLLRGRTRATEKIIKSEKLPRLVPDRADSLSRLRGELGPRGQIWLDKSLEMYASVESMRP